MYLSRGKKIALAIALTIIIGGGALFAVTSRRAIANVVEVPTLLVQWLKQFEVEETSTNLWKQAGIVALDQASQRLINSLAQKTAQWIATGGSGQSSLERRESFGKILQDTGEAALGDFLQEFSEESSLDKLGLNLCNPKAELKLGLSLELLDAARPQKQNDCTIQNIKDNWKSFADNGYGYNPENIGVNVSYGNKSSFGQTTGVGICKGNGGSCLYPGQDFQHPGICYPQPPFQPGPQLAKFCFMSPDCGTGWECNTEASESAICVEDTLCKDYPGTTCIFETGGQCLMDSDCDTAFHCEGATPGGGGIPWLNLTQNQTIAEIKTAFTDLFFP